MFFWDTLTFLILRNGEFIMNGIKIVCSCSLFYFQKGEIIMNSIKTLASKIEEATINGIKVFVEDCAEYEDGSVELSCCLKVLSELCRMPSYCFTIDCDSATLESFAEAISHYASSHDFDEEAREAVKHDWLEGATVREVADYFDSIKLEFLELSFSLDGKIKAVA